MKISTTPLFILPAFTVYIIFMMISLLYGIYKSFTLKSTGEFTLQNYVTILNAYTDVLLQTFVISAMVTVLLIVICIPMAYYLAVKVKSDTLKVLTLFILLVPFWTDWNTRLIAWYPVLALNGFFNQIWIGLQGILGFQVAEPMRILFTINGIIITEIQSYLLFMIVPIYLMLLRMNPNMLKAAATLGASRAKTFYHITLKWALPGIVVGSIFVFCVSFADYATPSLIGGGIQTIGLIAYLYAANSMNFNLASATSIVIIIVVMIFAIVLLRFKEILRMLY